jgi:glyoxylase-like metal-dependent hydrolase (beta-lactamase superfamily II)
VRIRPAVDAAIAQWLAEHHRTSIPLVVAHTHGHGDHRQGDGEFKDRPDTAVVGLSAPEVAAFFGIADWPKGTAIFDLGGRPLTIIPTPGHHPSHIMVYDPQARLLLSGDTLYPGRLYVPVNTFGDFRDSIDRVVRVVGRRKVAWLLGAHIEMTRSPGEELPDRPPHANEHALELPWARMLELQAAIHAMGDKPVRQIHDDFVIEPRPPR